MQRRPSVSGHEDPPGEAPWAMQLVVREERGVPLRAVQLYEAAARAVVELLASPEARAGGEWSTEVSRWLAGRIRKIVRRARGAAFERAALLPGVSVTVGGATVRAFVPGPVDAVPPELAKLQLQGLHAEDDPAREDSLAALARADRGTLVIAVNPGVAMSAGKTTAQVAHASNVAWLDSTATERAQWSHAAFPLEVVLCDPAGWLRFAEGADVEVHDAGFTEVAAGAFTVAARWAHGVVGQGVAR